MYQIYFVSFEKGKVSRIQTFSVDYNIWQLPIHIVEVLSAVQFKKRISSTF